MENKMELLAPAGGMEALRAAVQNGADAVYLGVSDFGARKYAANFDFDSLQDAVSYCHLRGVDVHLTLNTLVSDEEIPAFIKTATTAARLGVDAFIVQDLGCARLLRGCGVPLHASTQMTIHNTATAVFAKEFGFSRVVLARELSMEEIRQISSAAGIETEIFIHGALCICYSGQCLMSSIIGARSGNRGRCAQPCRLPYRLLQDEQTVASGYLLSPHDLSLSRHIPQLLRCGATSFKIEGRMKGADYVAAVTGALRQLIDRGENSDTKTYRALENIFSRGGFTAGFFAGETGRRMMNPSSSNDHVYQLQDRSLLAPLKQTYSPNANFKKLPVHAEFVLRIGEPMRLAITFGDTKVCVCGQEVSQAKTAPLTDDAVEKQLSKTGDAPFFFEHPVIDMDPGAFVPVSAINALRRSGLAALSSAITEKRCGREITLCPQEPRSLPNNGSGFAAQVSTMEQYLQCLNHPYLRVYLPARLLEENTPLEEKSALVFPTIIKDRNIPFYREKLKLAKKRGISLVKLSNLGLLSAALSAGMQVSGGSELNVFNRHSALALHEAGFSILEPSCELRLAAVRHLIKGFGMWEINVYGRLELMKIANCIISSSLDLCACSANTFALKDRKGECFPLESDPIECLNLLYNSKPVYLADKLGDFSGMGTLLLKFTTETPAQCSAITDQYLKGSGSPPAAFTRGHFYRGVQ